MAELEEQTQKIINDFARQIEALYNGDLVALILYGSGAGREYIPGKSDLNFLIILKEVTLERLKKSLEYIKNWRKQGISIPLFLDPAYIQSSRDVYPIEFLEMKEQHLVLIGEDVLKDLKVSPENLRLQCEQELKGKLLHLRSLYLETEGNSKRLEELMISSLKSFGVIMRNLLRLKDQYPPQEFLEIINEIGRAFGMELEAMREIYQVRLGNKRLEKAFIGPLFAKYINEVEELTRKADALFKGVK